MPNDPVILEKVKALITEILAVEPHEVTAEALFDADLGGESIDMIELGFRCERAFEARVRFQDLTAHDLSVGEDGTLTPESIERLQQRFPLLEAAHWAGRRFGRAIELLSIADLAAIIESEIRHPAAKAG